MKQPHTHSRRSIWGLIVPKYVSLRRLLARNITVGLFDASASGAHEDAGRPIGLVKRTHGRNHHRSFMLSE